MENYRTSSPSRFDIKFPFVWITKYRKLMMEFEHLQKHYQGRHLWARGYFVASSGNVSDEVIMEYIRNQENTESSDGVDNYQVTKQ